MDALNLKAVPLEFKAGGGGGADVAVCVAGSNVSAF